MSRKAYKELLLRCNREAGQSLLECALVLPLLLILLIGIIQFGAIFNALFTLNAAAREAARAYAVEGDEDMASVAAHTLCTAAPFLSCDEIGVDVQEVENKRETVTVTVTGQVPLFLFIFSENDLAMAGNSTMRLEPEVNEILE